MSVVSPFSPPARLTVDCAMGCASTLLPALLPHLSPHLTLNLLNVRPPLCPEVNTAVNELCGSEFVQNSRTVPKVYNGDAKNWADLAVSVDGDVDRIVFFRGGGEGTGGRVTLFDGDRINSLITGWIVRATEKETWEGNKIRVGAVQTAYANSNSTKYLRGLGVECSVVKTGVRLVS
ncbi:hypothetical protein TrRE_jg5000 [Triparma retinervis]|uniref:Phosphoacetylglucosamine mutase AMG1 domain-containing protein n=1 Tax=Triparma retinervis TaxID=2557542 RepID=A0A9W7DP35_9STRA|nr:hypothetical protein TrRE_jg5000 [Triparma retinervis]